MYPPAYEFLPTSQLIRPVIADWYTAGVFLRPPGKSTNRVSDKRCFLNILTHMWQISVIFLVFFYVNTRMQDYTYGEVMGKALIRPKTRPLCIHETIN